MNSKTSRVLYEAHQSPEPQFENVPGHTSGDVSFPFEPLLDSDETAALLKIHPKTLQRMARRGQLVGIQIGKLWRFRTSELNKFLDKIAA